MTIKELMTYMDGKGWCEEPKAQRIYDLVKETDSKITVEMGVFYGKSLFSLALAHKDKGSGFAIGIDPWSKNACVEGTNSPANNEWWSGLNFWAIFQNCLHDIEQLGLSDFCNIIRMKSQSVGLLMRDNSVDIIHQDSNHNIETITAELELWTPKLKVGGYWIADDTGWVETQEGYAKLPEYGLELVENHTTWQIWRKVK